MLKNPIRPNSESLIKLTVYMLLGAIIIWITSVLMASNLWSLKTGFTWRYLLPTIEIRELFATTIPAINFALILFFITTSIIQNWSTWNSLKYKTEYSLERKYAFNLVCVIAQSILLAQWYNTGSAYWWLVLLFVINIAFFLYSIRNEPTRKIIEAKP